MEHTEEAWAFYKELTEIFHRSANNCRHTETFTKELHELLSHFSGKLQALIEKYSDGFFETGILGGIADQGRLLGGSLSKVAASYKSLSVQLKSEVMEPFRMFMENFKATIEVAED